MGLMLRGAKFVYTGSEGEKILLDCGDYLVNKSSLPLQAEGENVLELLVELCERERLNGTQMVIPALLIDVLLADWLIRLFRPCRILEYGCGDGRLSSHLAELSGAFSEKSSLVCVCDALNMEWIKWKERLSKVERPPKISFLMGDYSDLPVRKKDFDIIFINGSVYYQEYHQMLLGAIEAAKDDGIIICYSENKLLLESEFKDFFIKWEEYEAEPQKKILLAQMKDRHVKESKEACYAQQAHAHLLKVQKIIEESRNFDVRAMMDMEKILKKDIETAVELGETELKIELLEYKKMLIESMLSGS